MRSQIFKTPLPYIALILAHMIWGANFVVAKITLTEFPVMSLAFSRFLIASFLIIPFLLTLEKKEKTVKFKHLVQFFLVGLLLITFNIAFFYEGMNRTDAINASALTLIGPVFSVVGSWLFLREKIFKINLLGIFMGLVGALVIIGFPLLVLGNFAGANFLGNSLIILSTASYTAGAILSKRMLSTYNPLALTAVLFIVGWITFLVPAALDYIKNPTWVNHVSILGLLGFFFITILSSVCAFFLLIWALSKIELFQANLVQYIEPAIAATLAVPLLHERISYSFIIGTCLIVLGVYWGTLSKQEHHHQFHRHHRS